MEKLKMKYNIGDKLILNMGSESFLGELHFINKDKTRLTMTNVQNLNTKAVYKSVQNYFTSDIVSIITDNDDYNEDESNNCESNTNNISLNSTINSNHSQQMKSEQFISIQRKNLKIQEFKRIENCLDNIKYITQTDINYHNALKDLNNQKLVAISIEPCKFGRNDQPTTIITIYSPDTNYVYIFDINFIGAIHTELANIFINRKIIKIIYDGRSLSDHLKYKHNINLDGIFDCLVSHLNITKYNKNINLIECLFNYINIPSSYFCDKEENIDWHARPLEDINKSLAAKTVILLYKLYEIHYQILNDKMIEKFSEICTVFAKTYCNNEDHVMVAQQMAQNDKTAATRVCNTNLNEHMSLPNIDN